MTAKSLLALCLIVVAVSALPNGLDEIRSQIYEYFPGSPCVRLLTDEGEVGCGYPINEHHRGSLYMIDSSTSLDEYLALTGSHHYIPVLTATMFHSEVVDSLSESKHTRGLLVLSDNPPSEGFSPDARAPVGTSYGWNPKGEDMLAVSRDLPIFALNYTESLDVRHKALQNHKQDFAYPHAAAELIIDMHAWNSTRTCLKLNMCDPVGGYSVWGTLPRNTKLGNDDVVLVSAALDANAFFHDLAYGSVNDMSGLVTVLAAVKALRKHESDLVRPILFALFNGEAYDLLGSSRFMNDLEGFKCDQKQEGGVGCARPFRLSTEFTDLALTNIAAAVDVRQVGYSDPDESAQSLFLHDDGDDNEKLIESVENVAQDTLARHPSQGIAVQMSSLAGSKGLPPSSLIPLLKHASGIPSVVLTDHDTTFTNDYYNSRFDNGDNVATHIVCKAATVLTRTLYGMSIAAEADDVNVQHIPQGLTADCDLVDELLDCLTVDFGCDLVRKYIDYAPSGKLTKYVGVFSAGSLSFMSHFVHDYLADVTETSSKGKCEVTADCDKDRSCVKGKCIKSSTRLHEAYSPAFEYNYESFRWEITDPSYVAWTESGWTQTYYMTYVVDSPTNEAAFFVIGLLVAIASFAVVFKMNDFYLKNIKVA